MDADEARARGLGAPRGCLFALVLIWGVIVVLMAAVVISLLLK